MSSYDEPELRRWRQQADAALGMAEAGSSASWSCFLCEQAAQLALKGLLHAIGEPRSAWGHDLAELERRVAAAFGADWPAVGDVAVRLGRHYIPTRYPDAHASGPPDAHYSPDDARAALADAARILDAIDAVVALLAEGDDG